MQYSILATYATFKELYNSHQYNSPYQILSEFIRYVIVTKRLYNFTTTDIQVQLYEEFGFNPPLAVIRTSLHNLDIVTRSHNKYIANIGGSSDNPVFKAYKNKSEQGSNAIIDALVGFVGEKYSEYSLSRESLSKEFISFVLDENGDDTIHRIIGEFIITNSKDPNFVNMLDAIREGSILYTGLSYNISEFGSLRKPITLFLDTEILFDIAGLNGEIYKALAKDFLSLVDAANNGEKRISLKYFDVVKDDIESFYYRAERIVEGKGEVSLGAAMKEIVTGCDSISDVSEKRVELFRKFRFEHGILNDDKTNYYSDSDFVYNLEAELQDKYPASEPANYEGLRFCSHINKLRKGYQTTDILDCKYACVTDTRRVLEISNALTESQMNKESGNRYADYALSLSKITNLLWYKLNRGFGGTTFPQNIDAVIKARIILSRYITQGITDSYNTIKEKYARSEITAEQAASYIIALREKPNLPEDISSDNISQELLFSEDYFDSLTENISTNKRLLEERDKIISDLNSEVDKLKNELEREKESGEQKQIQIDTLEKKVSDIEEKERAREIKKRNLLLLVKLIGAMAWKVLLLPAIVIVVWMTCRHYNQDFPTWLGIVSGIIGLVIGAIPAFTRDYKKYIESKS